MECTECGSEMELFDSGKYKHTEWHNYVCPECGNEETNEPDWDSLTVDNY